MFLTVGTPCRFDQKSPGSAWSDFLGCKDEAVLADLIGQVKFRDNPAKTADLQAVLRRAIHERPRWPDLKVEREPPAPRSACGLHWRAAGFTPAVASPAQPRG
jgi:hypothetical protein